MADIEQKVVVKADTSQAKRATQDLEKSMTKSFLKSQVAFEALKKGLDAGLKVLGSSIKAAQEYERTNRKLESALKNQGLVVGQNVKALNEMSSRLEILTGISDETIRSAQALALNFGVNVEKVDSFTRAAIRLSNTTGQTLDGAMRQLVKTTSGLAGELGEAVPAVRNLTEEELRAGKAIEILNEELKDNLDLLTQDLEGAVNRAANAFSSLGEALVLEATGGSTMSEVLNATSLAIETMTKILVEGGALAAIGSFFDIFLTGGQGGTLDIMESFQRRGDTALAPQGQRAAPAGKGKRGGRRGGRGVAPEGPVSFDFAGLGEGESSALTGDISDEFIQAEAIRQETIVNLTQQAETRMTEIRQQNLDIQIDLTNQAIESEESIRMKSATRMEAFEKQRFNKFVSLGTSATQTLAGNFIDAFEMMARGEQVAMDQIVLTFLKGQGQKLIGTGIADGAEGAARLIRSYGVDQSGTALLAQGAAEIALGTALTAGSLAISSATGGGGGGTAATGGAGGFGGGGGFTGGGGTGGAIDGGATPGNGLGNPFGAQDTSTFARGGIGATLEQSSTVGDTVVYILSVGDDISDEAAAKLQRSINRAQSRGFV